LDQLMKIRYGMKLECPKCKKHGGFSRIKKMPAYACQWCGHHIHPMVGTIFEDSRTPLQKWFYAMFLFSVSRNGVSARELQRQLSVTLKCAWRMGHQIRKYLADTDGNSPLGGEVEADETYIGGRRSGGKRGAGASGKTIVMGMLEREGPVMTHVIPNARRVTLHPLIERNVKKGSILHTDENLAYRNLYLKGYDHQRVNHSAGEYVRGKTHINSLEGFWSMIKRSIRGTHVWVSPKHMPKYLGEFEYRYNMRKCPEAMFSRLLLSF
jgi:transposase